MKTSKEGIHVVDTSFKQGMRVPAWIIASKELFDQMEDAVFDQITNVACLPGIEKAAICMPDGHWGYGFPIGGVAAFRIEDGIISPGGIGFDINCGMRLITTHLTYDQIKNEIVTLIDDLFRAVPSGVGTPSLVKLEPEQLKKVMVDGSAWCVKNGYGRESDLEHMEDYGSIKGADPAKVSDKAIKRGKGQVGSLGSGNHYLEIQRVSRIDDENLAQACGVFEDQICIMVHTGSRGFGHQVATDYVRQFGQAIKKYNIDVKDRQLACAPINSVEGKDYFAAMCCAANVAFANRQIITHKIRETFCKALGAKEEDLGLDLVYDVAHNIAKFENNLLVHRKGATRSLGPGNKLLPKAYQQTGQPLLLGGSMETGSYLLFGTKKAEKITFGSTAHGSGRTMSRKAAIHKVHGKNLQKQMSEKGIYIRSGSMRGLAEEAGFAYKDINQVVESLNICGISKPAAYLTPIGNIKG